MTSTMFFNIDCKVSPIELFAGLREMRWDTIEETLDPEGKLSAWLEKASSRKGESGLVAILASRKKHSDSSPNFPLRYVPFTRSQFEQITELFPLHGDTARIIDRKDVAFFCDINLTDTLGPEKALYYCCRTPGTSPGDLAVSAVFYPDTGYTAGVVFGCTDSISEDFSGRIRNGEEAWTHPMFLFGLLAEHEKERHKDLVDEKVAQLTSRVYALSKFQRISSETELNNEHYSVNLWIEVSQLRTAMEMWKKELVKMDEHIGELESHVLTIPEANTCESPFAESMTTLGDKTWRVSAREVGRRIQKRLREIMCEYDGRIRECTMVLDGMALSAQLSWSQIGYQDTQANLKIASDTRRDSSRMRSIAFLTMVFLPATFISSLFSTTFFDFRAEDIRGILSPYFWVYPVVTIVITALVMGTWILVTRRRRQKVEGTVLSEKLPV
ncbi:hypothetical protein OQA88_8664 [Cercophora sp. LCS_1]